jgi:small-conductance mechanosensitive channel
MLTESFYIRIIETIIAIVLFIVLRKLYDKLIEKKLSKSLIHRSRGIVVKKAVNITFSSIFILIIFLIWGVKQSDLAVFVGSVLTVVGVALFAQWSLLSNVTSSIIIFFNHNVKLNDSIIILEGKDYVIEGRVIDIGLFFVTLAADDLQEITIPNNVFIQKSIKKKAGN